MNDKHIQIIGFLVHPKKERISLMSHFKKCQSAPAPILTTESAAASSGSGGRAAPTRNSRKTKNPLSIINDTNNNVITITYDETIDLPSEPTTKEPKAAKAAKEPKAAKTPKAAKIPKEPKASKKDNTSKAPSGAAAAIVTTNE
jgi:hypothetical protein